MNHEQWQAIFLSLQVATVSTVVSLPFAVAVAWLLSRVQGIGRVVLETIVNLPLVLPPVITGYLLLVTFGRNGLVGKTLHSLFGLEFVFDFKGAVLAAAIVSFPLMVRAVRLALDSVDQRFVQAAKTLGANPWNCFWKIVLPLSRRGLIAGCLLAFARSLGEFGATIMVAGNIAGETKTIPLFVYDQLQTPGGFRNCLPVIVFSILIAVIALLVSSRLEYDDAEVAK
jgi:molybdate transport system permease protein